MQWTKSALVILAGLVLLMCWIMGNIIFWEWMANGSDWEMYATVFTSIILPVLGGAVLLDLLEK